MPMPQKFWSISTEVISQLAPTQTIVTMHFFLSEYYNFNNSCIYGHIVIIFPIKFDISFSSFIELLVKF